MFEKKRLHPVAIITNALKQIKDGIIPIIAAVFFGGNTTGFDRFFIFILPIGIVSLMIISGFVKWLRYRYWLEDEELRVEYGLFVRKQRYIPIERIQSISTSQGIFHQIFNLVQVNVETAGGTGLDEADAALTAIKKQEANDLQEYIKQVKAHKIKQRINNENGQETIEEELEGIESVEKVEIEENLEVIYKMTYRDIFVFALTSGGALGIIAAVFAFLSQFGDLISFDILLDEVEEIISAGILLGSLLILFAIIVAYIIAIARNMLKYANFTLKKSDENLYISHGLLEKKNIMVPLKRIQAIKVHESLIRGLFGYTSVAVVSGGGSLADEQAGKILICPIIKRDHIAEIIEKAVPKYKITTDFNSVPKRAKTRYMIRPMLAILLPVAVGIYFLYPYSTYALLLLLLFPIFAFFGYRGYRYAGWNITDNQLALRSRFINSSTVYMFRNKIQSINQSKTWFQNRKQLGTIEATVMSSMIGEKGKTIDLDHNDLQTIYRWYSRTI